MYPFLQRALVRVLVVATCAVAPVVRGASPSQVETSLGKARQWLWSQQKNGNWEEVQVRDPKARGQLPSNGQFTGMTALALLALLNSGESPQDQRIKEAVAFVRKNETKGVYALGLRCQLWLTLPRSPQTEQAMRADAKLLMSSVKQVGLAKGMYDYIPGTDDGYSHSRAQYGVLGMWAAAQMGVEIPDAYWQLVEDGWERNQDKSGGWTYQHPSQTKHPVTPGMTTVGVASLFITEEMLRGHTGINCKGASANTALDNGIAWLVKNIDAYPDKRSADWKGRAVPYPTLYAYERVGAASGLRYFGDVDWYETGADWAISQQNANGSWTKGDGVSFMTHANTCFAMLFLAKGRAPLVMSKLQYGGAGNKPGQWDQRPRDVANVVKWTGRLLERELAWQIVTLDNELKNLVDSPIMAISGGEALTLPDTHRAKLKAYLEAGGLLLANADCGSQAFTASIRKLATEIFPDYEFAAIPDDHPLYIDNYPRKQWKTKPRVEMLSNGARPLIVLVPDADINRAWQLQDARARQEAFELAANLVLFVVDGQSLRYRGERYYLPDNPKLTASQTVTVARLNYGAASDPEPGGWRRLNNVMDQRQSVSVATRLIELGKDPIPAEIKVAHLTGTAQLKLSEPQREALRKFVEVGGTLVVDAAGGRAEFATAMEAELAQIWPGVKPEMLPASHPLYSIGADPKRDAITYRPFARRQVGSLDSPRLQGLTIDNRLAVIYSREDLSVGLVGQQIGGIVGYTPETATNLMIRILNYTTGIANAAPSRRTNPATQPASPAMKKKRTGKQPA